MEIQYHQLVNYLNGHADEVERTTIEHWRQENEADFQKWKAIWEQSDQIAQNNLPDIDLNWQKVEAKIQLPKTIQRKGSQRRMFISGLAASVALLIAFGISFYQTRTIRFEADVSNALVQLPDGSQVWLYNGSSLEYPNSFFRNGQRKVRLEGEGFFDVHRNEEKPFLIEGQNASVKVLGTSFLLNLPNHDLEQSVQVSSGRVAFFQNQAENDGIILEKGEEGFIKEGYQNPEKRMIEDPNFMAWHTRKLTFNATPLAEVFNQIEKVYHVEIQEKNEEILACTLTITFEQQNLKDIFLALETIYQLKFQSNSLNSYEVSGVACD